MKNRTTARRRLRGLATAVAFCSVQTLAAAEPDKLVCGFENVEDMVEVPGTPWIIGSGIGDKFFQSGGLHLIHEETATGRKMVLNMADTLVARAPYDECPGPVNAELFSAHGLSLVSNGDGKQTLYVVNHGARESIEVFEVTSSPEDVTLEWIGCVETPANAMSNSVAGRPDGSLVMSASGASEKPMPGFHDLSRMNLELGGEGDETDGEAMQYGAVFTWTREAGWKKVEGSELPGNNGIELSKDGKWAFVNSWPGKSVTHMPLDPALGESREIKLSFNPDNIRWSDDGKLVATGQVADMKAVAACVMTDSPNCPLDYRAAVVDPETYEVTALFDGTGTEHFGVATIGLKTGGSLWLGAVRSDCVAKVDLSGGD